MWHVVLSFFISNRPMVLNSTRAIACLFCGGKLFFIKKVISFLTSNWKFSASCFILLPLILNTCGFQMNQLQSELRLARSIIEEKDTEIQRIRNANNQVC